MRIACAATAVLTLGGACPVHAATVEEVVARQLAWLGKTDTYLAEIRTSGLHTGKLGTVFVDNTVKPAKVLFQGDVEFPSKVTRKLEIAGTQQNTAASLAGRSSAWTLSEAPFGNSFALFERGMTVEDAMARLRQATSEITVIENPQGGVTGLRMTSNPDFLKKMDGMLDSILLGGTLPGGVETTLWFKGDGRLERMVLSESGRDELITTLHYLETNLPPSKAGTYKRSAEAVATAAAQGPTSAEVCPSFYEMLLAVQQDEAATQGGPSEKGK